MNKKNHRRGSAQLQSIPESLESLTQSFRCCFTKPSFRNFTLLLVGWILCRRRRWITKVATAGGALESTHLSTLYRFFSSAPWEPGHVGRQLLRLLLGFLPQTIEVMVDDTLCRRAGPRIFGISMHHDGAASSYGTGASGKYSNLACGHSWVVLSVRVPLPWNERGLAVPILARLYRSPKRCSVAEYRKRTEIAREMVHTLAKWLPADRGLHLTGDREYACKTVLRGLDPSIEFTGPMPMDAMLYEPSPGYQGRGRPRLKGKRLPSPKARAGSSKANWRRVKLTLYGRKTDLLVQTWTCLWYTATGQRLVRVVLTRDPKGNYQDRAFFSTELEAPAQQILQRFAGRWLIEVSFRDAKQLFGLTDPQNGFSRGKRRKGRPKPGPQPRGNRGRKAVERTVPFIWAVYGIVVVWYLRSNRWQRDVQRQRARAPWYRTKATPSFEDMVEALRLEILSHRLLAKPLRTRTLAETRRTLMALGMAV